MEDVSGPRYFIFLSGRGPVFLLVYITIRKIHCSNTKFTLP